MIAQMSTAAQELGFRPFYVTGLPRSRTAWLSVALSDWQQSVCLHEPLARMTYGTYERPDPDTDTMTTVEGRLVLSNLTSALLSMGRPFAGIADSGLPVVAPDLPTLLPGPVLVVWRDPDEVIESLVNYLGGDRDTHAGGVALMQACLVAFVEQLASVPWESTKHPVLSVEFDQLSDMRCMQSVWRHLLPGVPFNRHRIDSLQRLRIDPDPAQLLDGLTDSARSAAVERLT